MSASVKRLSRRGMLKVGAGLLGAGALSACQPVATPQVIEKVVTQIVEGTPQVVKETVIVEKTVEVPVGAGPVEIRGACYSMGDAWMANMDSIVADFSTANPDVKVKWEWRPGQGFWEKLQTEFAGGTAPDVCINQVNWVIPGAARGMFLDIKPFIERDAFDMSDVWYPTYEWEWQNGLYGFGSIAAANVVWMNKTILGNAGLEMPNDEFNWDDFLTYAQAMTDKANDQWGALDFTGHPATGCIGAFIVMAGGSVLNEAKDKCTINEPPCIEAAQFLVDLIYKHEVSPKSADREGKENHFMTGKAAMTERGTWIEDQVRSANLFDWDWCPYPKHPQTGKRTVMIGSNVWSIIANTQYRDAAWKFIAYLQTAPAQAKFAKYGIPTSKTVVESQEYIDAHKPQNVSLVINEMDCCGHDYYITADVDEWWNVLGQELDPMWSGEMSVEEALNNATKAVDEVFARRPEWYKNALGES